MNLVAQTYYTFNFREKKLFKIENISNTVELSYWQTFDMAFNNFAVKLICFIR